MQLGNEEIDLAPITGVIYVLRAKGIDLSRGACNAYARSATNAIYFDESLRSRLCFRPPGFSNTHARSSLEELNVRRADVIAQLNTYSARFKL